MPASRGSLPLRSLTRALAVGAVVVVGGGAGVAAGQPPPAPDLGDDWVAVADSDEPVSPPARRSWGLEAGLFAGVQNPASDHVRPYDAGPRLGGQVGWRLSERISLGVEAVYDRLTPAPSPSNRFRPCGTCAFEDAHLRGWSASVSAAGTVHYPFGRGEVLLGARLGLTRLVEHADSGGAPIDAAFTGFVVGVEAGLAFDLGHVALGPLITLDNQTFREVCLTDADGEVCRDAVDVPGDESGTIASLLLAVWY